MVWRVENKVTGKMQCWYEAELIERISYICKPALNHSFNADVFALGQKHIAKQVLDCIQENERR
jgi:hypothetical protein